MTSYKLPINLIRQYLFCPRVVYFLEVLNIPKASPEWVKEGTKHHIKQTELFKRRTLARFGLENAEFKTNVSLSNDKFSFYGICDALIIGNTHIYPVEIKLHGDKPTFAQKMQLVAYGMIAEELYKKQFDTGFMLYEKNAKTVPIKTTEQDKQKVNLIAEEIITMIQNARLPYSSADDSKCTQCEFLNYCNDRF